MRRWVELLEVSRSGFYRPHQEDKSQKFDAQIKEIFERNKGRYGSPRVQAELKKNGVNCSRNKVERRMKTLGLYAGKRKRKVKTTHSLERESQDLLKRDFTANAPNKKWCADITYRRCFYLPKRLVRFICKKSDWMGTRGSYETRADN